jgi:MFS family permease
MSGGIRSPVALIALMCVAEVFSMTGVATYTTLIPVLTGAWGLSNSEAGLGSGVFYAGYVTAVPVLASLTDRVDTRRVYVFACVVASTGAVCFALFAQGIASAMAFQFMIGFGLAGTYMPGLKALTDQLDGAAQSRGTAFYVAFFGAGSSLSILVSGLLVAHFPWSAAFLFAAAGPLVAAPLVWWGMPHKPPLPQARTALLDFRPVLRNRRIMLYVVGYSAHNYELFGMRAWMVAFLVFCAGLRAEGPAALTAAALLAAAVNVMAPIGSISGNELALRYGRTRVIFIVMGLSGLITCSLGLVAGLPLWVMFAILCVHCLFMLGDSAALTSGMVATAPPELRGSALAVYSCVGFGAAFLAPLVFGVVLDLAGGRADRMAWALAFVSIGIFGVLSPVARFLYQRTAPQA